MVTVTGGMGVAVVAWLASVAGLEGAAVPGMGMGGVGRGELSQ